MMRSVLPREPRFQPALTDRRLRNMTLVSLAGGKEKEQLRKQLRLEAWRGDPEYGCAVVCSRGGHRTTRQQLDREIRDVLGCCPTNVLRLVEAAASKYRVRKSRKSPPVNLWGEDQLEWCYHARINEREPGNIALRTLESALHREIWRAKFRGRPEESSGVASSPQLNWHGDRRHGRKYDIRTTTEFFRVPKPQRSREGVLMLTPTVRVVQGRGHHLEREDLVDGRWTRKKES